MELKIYTGNYTLRLGQPYVIMSAKDSGKEFIAEKFIIFEASDEPKIIARKIKYPKIENRSLEDFINTEKEVCKEEIRSDILFQYYQNQLEQLNYDVKIELIDSNPNLLRLLRNKFPEILEKIKNNTMNAELKKLINIYQSIEVEEIDMGFAK